ncbi:MAG: GNAT family N-acetyltransferase [Bacteroidales bacterium]
MSFQVRAEEALPADLSEITLLEQQCFGIEAFSKQQMRYLLTKANSIFLMIRKDNKISAYIVLLMRKNSKAIRIYSIAVSPEFRGCGLAKLLIEEAVIQANKLNCNSIRLEVSENNKAAIKLYQQQGFVQFGEKQSYYKDASNALLMVKTLHI